MRSISRNTTRNEAAAPSALRGGAAFPRPAHRGRNAGRVQQKRKDTQMRVFSGRSVIIGFQKTQIYQRFAGSRQEVFILKIQNDESNAAQQDNGRRFNMGTELMLETL